MVQQLCIVVDVHIDDWKMFTTKLSKKKKKKKKAKIIYIRI